MFAEAIHNEKELLALISQGDQASFTSLFNQYRNKVYTVAYKISASSVLSEEVVQDVFLKIWLKRADLGHVNSFSAYLHVIVQNTMYKRLKSIADNHRRASQSLHEQNISTADPEVQLIDKEYHSILQQAIEKLPQQQKQVYRLIRENGLKRGEVAVMLNLQSDTVKFHLSKAVKNLRSYCQLHSHLLAIAIVLTAFFKL